MRQTKDLLDPDGILNPGVILNSDPQSHLKNLKVMPVVSPLVDKCIECGFCEPRCPSRDLTTTPRQRIALAREMARLRSIKSSGEDAYLLHELEAQYQYYGIETCAGDGMCATSCPVKIDTGNMIKEMRSDQHSPAAHRRAVYAAKHFQYLTSAARMGLRMVNIAGPLSRAAARAGSTVLHAISGGTVPKMPRDIPVPKAARRLPGINVPGSDGKARLVYFPSCLTRTLSSIPGESAATDLASAVIQVLSSVGYAIQYPGQVQQLCCGQAFYSKGFFPAAAEAATKTVEALYEASDNGQFPIICDTSPCSGQLLGLDKMLSGETLKKWKALRLFDFPEFMATEVIPKRNSWTRLDRNVILHPTCTLIKINGLSHLKKIASTFASRVTVPVRSECCGFAGDKGFNVPELTLSATQPEAAEVIEIKGQTSTPDMETCYYSTCRTCEIGMTAATHESYQSIVYLCYDALVSTPHS
jgi:D-lactate dehydrogenase